MPKISNRQPVLKPQDLYVLFALLSRGGGSATYQELAEQTGLAISAVHGALKRAFVSRLAMFQDRRPVVLKPQLRDFVLFGAKYAFPPTWGTLTRGVPTGYAAAPLNQLIESGGEPVPVWPYAEGSVRGLSLAPLYPSVPQAALKDERLYALLALFDAIRSGQARERDAAQKLLEPFFQ
ncbi:MAG: MarR family winged helix-turn-helix transcriptional regulator [Burkholderiales bacterium]|nr:MarR family winged helix-turn-helix transcriptional regulator [Burkholderiales bacterium]